MTADKQLKDIFDADRRLREAEKALLAIDKPQLTPVLTSAVAEAMKIEEEDEAAMRLQRLADLCAQVPGPKMADALIEILDSDLPQVRVAAAEALVDVAFERYAEVARAVERALENSREGHALGELPWVIAEIAEPSAVPLIGRFLKLEDPTLVASAAEALAALGDAEAIALLEPLVDDPRGVPLDEFEGEVTATLGELVREVIDTLSAADFDEEDEEFDEN
jgi:HEAT repeat protein